ncbi:hypothetical protein Rleg10DRAFT_2842 [Rhizobium leguminosarum bv. trifolii WSM2012]|nr:hypothetical protein Rleg10DRAFT_2842 [Rhizobium leguminosarum bv. trifolii WSM2012]
MDELKKLTNRGSLIKEVELFAERLYAQNLVARPDNERSFHEVSLGEKYRPQDAIALLLDPSPSFFGHKEATFAGFTSWTMAPTKLDLRRELIGFCIKDLLAKSELSALDEFGERSILMRDLIARHIIAGPQFVEQIYAAYGGMSVLSEFGSRLTLDYIFEDKRKSFYTLTKMMAACHLVADCVPSDGPNQPSVNKAVVTVRAFIDPKIMSRASIYATWAECKSTIAWIYAAESLRLKNSTLLEVLLNAEATFEEYGEMFGDWARRAKFFCEHVLRRMPDRELYDSNVRPLRKVELQPFSLLPLSPSEEALVRKAHKLKP